MSTEHQRIARIRSLFSRDNPSISLGIGDDCAVLAASPALRVWTIDAAIEEVHFSRTFMRDADVGYRAFMAAASDIAAMGAQGTAALCALAFPQSFGDDALDALLSGLAHAADELSLPIVGGNLARASELSITTTVLGTCARAVTRAGATPGDGIFVSGSVGGAALGLRALSAGLAEAPAFAEAIARFLRPRARLDVAQRLAESASSAIDISDGLAQDLGHLCEASRVGAELELARIPRIGNFDALCGQLQADAATLLLSGGEDYELLYTAPPQSDAASFGTRIGTIVPDEHTRVRVTDESGRELPLSAGFDHFS